MKNIPSVIGVIIAGVGGQGAVTLSQLVITAAWKSNYNAVQSEVHGMSQRGGSVNAQILISKYPVTSPTILEGTASLLIGMEPLETLRYFNLLAPEAKVITSISPVKNMQNYPDIDEIINEIKKNNNSLLLDTLKISQELNNKGAGNIVLLGVASKSLPFTSEIWKETIINRFQDKAKSVIDANLKAFEYGEHLNC